MPKRIIPFKRPLTLGSRGKDVRAVKRALARAGHGSLKGITPVFGPFAVRNLKAFQKRIPGINPSGSYGKISHNNLAPFFDDYAMSLYNGQPVVRKASKEEMIRAKIVAAALLAKAHAPLIHYTQTSKRMQGVREKIRLPKFPIWEDCSSMATWTYWAAGAPDPNGRGYDGAGYTGTLALRGRQIAEVMMKPGDLVLYGFAYPHKHVAIYVGGGKVVSHGSEGGPYLLPTRYRADLAQCRTYL